MDWQTQFPLGTRRKVGGKFHGVILPGTQADDETAGSDAPTAKPIPVLDVRNVRRSMAPAARIQGEFGASLSAALRLATSYFHYDRKRHQPLARLRHASHARRCPQFGVDRKTFTRHEYFRVSQNCSTLLPVRQPRVRSASPCGAD